MTDETALNETVVQWLLGLDTKDDSLWNLNGSVKMTVFTAQKFDTAIVDKESFNKVYGTFTRDHIQTMAAPAVGACTFEAPAVGGYVEPKKLARTSITPVVSAMMGDVPYPEIVQDSDYDPAILNDPNALAIITELKKLSLPTIGEKADLITSRLQLDMIISVLAMSIDRLVKTRSLITSLRDSMGKDGSLKPLSELSFAERDKILKGALGYTQSAVQLPKPHDVALKLNSQTTIQGYVSALLINDTITVTFDDCEKYSIALIIFDHQGSNVVSCIRGLDDKSVFSIPSYSALDVGEGFSPILSYRLAIRYGVAGQEIETINGLLDVRLVKSTLTSNDIRILDSDEAVAFDVGFSELFDQYSVFKNIINSTNTAILVSGNAETVVGIDLVTITPNVGGITNIVKVEWFIPFINKMSKSNITFEAESFPLDKPENVDIQFNTYAINPLYVHKQLDRDQIIVAFADSDEYTIDVTIFNPLNKETSTIKLVRDSVDKSKFVINDYSKLNSSQFINSIHYNVSIKYGTGQTESIDGVLNAQYVDTTIEVLDYTYDDPRVDVANSVEHSALFSTFGDFNVNSSKFPFVATHEVITGSAELQFVSPPRFIITPKSDAPCEVRTRFTVPDLAVDVESIIRYTAQKFVASKPEFEDLGFSFHAPIDDTNIPNHILSTSLKSSAHALVKMTMPNVLKYDISVYIYDKDDAKYRYQMGRDTHVADWSLQGVDVSWESKRFSTIMLDIIVKYGANNSESVTYTIPSEYTVFPATPTIHAPDIYIDGEGTETVFMDDCMESSLYKQYSAVGIVFKGDSVTFPDDSQLAQYLIIRYSNNYIELQSTSSEPIGITEYCAFNFKPNWGIYSNIIQSYAAITI